MQRAITQEKYIANADGTAASPAALATSYATLAALLAALPDGAAFIDMAGEAVEQRNQRIDVYPTGVGNEDTTTRYDVYCVFSGLGESLSLDKAGQVTATLGTDAVIGGRTSNVWAKTVAWSTTNLIEGRTGQAVQAFGSGGAGSRCGISVPDLGNARGLVLVPAKGASGPATSCSAIYRRWQ